MEYIRSVPEAQKLCYDPGGPLQYPHCIRYLHDCPSWEPTELGSPGHEIMIYISEQPLLLSLIPWLMCAVSFS